MSYVPILYFALSGCLCVSIRMNIRIKIREDIDALYVMICNGGSSHNYFYHVFFQLEIVYKRTF